MKRIILGVIMLAASGSLVAAQIYRWVDEKGNVEYRDTPPPSSAKKVEQRTVGGSAVEASSLPFSVQQAVKNFPVTLWNSTCGAPCDLARAHLARRGVPHTEKDPQNNVEAFEKLTGGIDVPVLYVGSNRIKGYFESEWDSALDFAGYPRTAPPGAKPAAKGPAAIATPADLPQVKLYTHADCDSPCSGARSLLSARGVKFEEAVVGETVQFEELGRLAPDLRVPVLVIGESVTRGFNPVNYHAALDAAGFPRSQQSAKP
jgi:glutaredoxin